MTTFSPAALRSLRQLNLRSLDSRATIEAPATAATGGGGANTGKKTWATVDGGDDVACRLATTEGAPVVIQAGQLSTPDHVLVVFDVEGPAVADGYRLTVRGADLAGGPWERVVVVLSSANPRTNSAMRSFVCQDVGPSGA